MQTGLRPVGGIGGVCGCVWEGWVGGGYPGVCHCNKLAILAKSQPRVGPSWMLNADYSNDDDSWRLISSQYLWEWWWKGRGTTTMLALVSTWGTSGHDQTTKLASVFKFGIQPEYRWWGNATIMMFIFEKENRKQNFWSVSYDHPCTSCQSSRWQREGGGSNCLQQKLKPSGFIYPTSSRKTSDTNATFERHIWAIILVWNKI